MIVIGASGSIMGLIGSTGAILLRGWRVDSAAIAHRRLTGICIIIALQTFFDMITPQVSLSAHIIGAGLGFLITLILHVNLSV